MGKMAERQNVLNILEGCVVIVSVGMVTCQCGVPTSLGISVILAIQTLCIVWQHIFLPSTQQLLYRSGADPGILCCLLVPLAVLADLGSVNRLTNQGFSEIKVNLEKDFYVVCLMFLLSWYPSNKENKLKWWLRIVLQISGILLFSNKFAYKELCIVYFLIVIFYWLNENIPTILPRSFTYGELFIVSQILVLTLWRILNSILPHRSSLFSQADIFCSIGILGTIIAVILSYICDTSRHPSIFYVIYIGTAAIFILPMLFFYLDEFPVLWLINFIFETKSRILLLGYWVGCSLVAGCIVGYISMTGDGQDMTTIIRKYFHIVVVAVYIPGFIIDVQFLYLSSVVALAFFVILETVRVCKVLPFGDIINQSFCLFVDDRDGGIIILTHLYLLVGISSPVWLVKSFHYAGELSLYSGILSLGVGDTVASIAGSSIGRCKWPGSKKTVEGTVCSIFSQCVVVYILCYFNCVEIVYPWRVLTAIILTSLYEAFTLQIDNLVLPLLMFSLLTF